ncbi:MAG: T9SS C-terminal target domain-containing protein, partial [Calditrichaeota bacterium]
YLKNNSSVSNLTSLEANNNAIWGINGAFFSSASTFHDAQLKGKITIVAHNNVFEGTTVVVDTLTSSDHWTVFFLGTFQNNGFISPAPGPPMNIFASGDVGSTGPWNAVQTTLNGLSDQHVGVSHGGSIANFKIDAMINGSSYQWLKNGTPIAGATGKVLSLGTLTAADSGVYQCSIDGGAQLSRIITVDTSLFPLAAPTPVSPPDLAMAVSTAPSLQWSPVANAVRYRVEVNLSQDFTGTVIVDTDTVSQSQLNLAGLAHNTTYYWRVRGIDTFGNPGPASATFQFTIRLATPQLLSPAMGDSVSASPLLVWQSVPGADSYRVQVSLDSLFSADSLVFADPAVADTSVQLSNLAPDVYYWRVTAHNTAGNSSEPSAVYAFVVRTVTGLPDVQEPQVFIPRKYDLQANYPNPFNPTTTIVYDIPEATDVQLVIFNALGQRVRLLVHARQQAGRYRVQWDGRDEQGRSVASGIYIYQLHTPDFSRVRRMVLLK